MIYSDLLLLFKKQLKSEKECTVQMREWLRELGYTSVDEEHPQARELHSLTGRGRCGTRKHKFELLLKSRARVVTEWSPGGIMDENGIESMNETDPVWINIPMVVWKREFSAHECAPFAIMGMNVDTLTHVFFSRMPYGWQSRRTVIPKFYGILNRANIRPQSNNIPQINL